MKKVIAFLLVLTLSASLLTVFMAKELLYQGENVSFTLINEFGDRKYLDGITVDTLIGHSDMLMWKSSFDFNENTSTELSFYKTRYRYLLEKQYWGLDFGSFNIIDLKNENEKLGEYLGDFQNGMAEGERKTFTVRMKDYFRYYPIHVNLHLPDIYIDFVTYNTFEKGYYEQSGITKERAEGFIRACEEFFRVPVADDDIREYGIEAGEYGYSYSSEFKNSFGYSTYNAVFPGKCYMTFDNCSDGSETSPPTLLDTSLIPGGYGIYLIPFGDGDVYYEDMKNVYPLDPESRVISFWGDEEKGLLYCAFCENGKLYFRIIDESTMTDIFSAELFSFGYGDYMYYQGGEDFFVFFKNDREIAVVSKNSDSTYKIAMKSKISEEDHTVWPYYPYAADIAFTGDRLIFAETNSFAAPEENVKNCMLSVTVVKEEGIVYFGEWESSLSEYVDWGYNGICNFADYGEGVKIKHNLSIF